VPSVVRLPRAGSAIQRIALPALDLSSHRFCEKPVPTFARDALELEARFKNRASSSRPLSSHRLCEKTVTTFARECSRPFSVLSRATPQSPFGRGLDLLAEEGQHRRQHQLEPTWLSNTSTALLSPGPSPRLSCSSGRLASPFYLGAAGYVALERADAVGEAVAGFRLAEAVGRSKRSGCSSLPFSR